MKKPNTPLHLGPIPLVQKRAWIIPYIEGKTVLHAGATDYPLHAKKAKRGELLHTFLRPYCSKFIGIDLAGEAIECLRRDHDITDIIHGNVEELGTLFPPESFDVIVAGDVVEHINNVGLFFDSARKILKKDGIILVTVPNAFSIKRMLGAFLLRQERNHPDHMYYFSLMNLEQAAWRNEGTIIDMATFIYEAENRFQNRIANIIVRTILAITRNNFLADELAVAIQFRTSPV
ncbi:MAG TPA: class I SAM-dependent methyltransferase [Terrimicrobiaceae bacterium]|nr:class I SAM-dependent methyltransferase [Terrimicrobiaceae bacterium]